MHKKNVEFFINLVNAISDVNYNKFTKKNLNLSMILIVLVSTKLQHFELQLHRIIISRIRIICKSKVGKCQWANVPNPIIALC